MAKTTPLIIILAVAAAASACNSATPPAPVNRIEGLSYVTPPLWKESVEDEGGALLSAPEGVGMYFPSIIVTLGGKPVTREMAEKTYAIFESNPYYKMSPLEKMVVSGAPGWTYSRLYVDKIARTLPRPKTGDYPLDVEHVETKIMLDVGGVAYHIRYNCPTALHEKYKPEFERFLATLKFDAKQL